MPIIYNKLFHLLIEMGIKKGELQKEAGITASIMARLAKNESVRTDTIGKICEALNCQPGDIMEFILIEELLDKKGIETEYIAIKNPRLYEESIPIIKNKNSIDESEL
ncbi:helix-turn-helix domain-containing protein [Enterocloster bolteae]|uniref:helix-turn-helix domain-containing protein n=1 Tax=Enterocloster bolteae TaxID=208479 RepID=UPI000E54E492|nr:helix-turn-helix transcriptional regulator [Enterocloster bolteae]RGS05049.1 XRE family transcriptional regulator [Enterocloster bolteae]